MKKYLSIVVTILLLTFTLLINNNVKYYGLLSLFLLLPYSIHSINLVVRKKLAVSDCSIGQEANRQLPFFTSKIYKLIIVVPTFLLAIGLFVFYIFLMIDSNESIKLQNVFLLILSGALLIAFLKQFYSKIRNS